MVTTLRVRLLAGVADAIREPVVEDQWRPNDISWWMFDFQPG
jgi:hypothetical protein